MNSRDSDKVFSGSVPALYESHLVPLIFEFYADDLARRVASRGASKLLEVAAGTGVVTRKLAAALPADVSIVASDLNQPMLDMAARVGTARPVRWQRADAMTLPFDDGSFDLVVCQFGVMFFPEKMRALAEARRVLRKGGALLFNVWDRIEKNDFADTVTTALATIFPKDPPRFLARTPHGYHDLEIICRDLQGGGFVKPPNIETLAAQSRAASSLDPAVAYCQGTPLRNEIEARGGARLSEATDIAERAIRQRYGAGPVAGTMQAHVVTVEK